MSSLAKAKKINPAALFAALLCFFLPAAHASLTVWVNFDSDWETRLEEAADNAEGGAISHFSSGERATIESNIMSELNRIYADYQITFDNSASDPGGVRNVIEFGQTGGANVLGVAPSLRLANRTHDHPTVNSSAKVFTAEFWRYIENSDSRATQISELSTTLAGTAAHELGHSLGLQHNHAYGCGCVTHGNYADTGGGQNASIIATGSTGLDEAGRETQRSLNRWEQALLDFAGGGLFGGATLVNNTVNEEGESFDAGATAGGAQALTLTTGETSGLQLAHLRGDLDASGGGASDIDMFSFSASHAGWLTAEIMSYHLYSTGFDPTVSIFDTDGTTLLASNDDGTYQGNEYDSGEFPGSGSTPPYGNEDSFLPNVYLPAGGTYYIRVEVASSPQEAAATGDDYTLLAGFFAQTGAAPEPSTVGLALLGASLLRHTRKKKLSA